MCEWFDLIFIDASWDLSGYSGGKVIKQRCLEVQAGSIFHFPDGGPIIMFLDVTITTMLAIAP